MTEFTRGYTFDDVLLVPKRSNVSSRDDVDLSVKLPRGIKLGLPLVSANMKTVTGPEMAASIAKLGGLAILHRFDTRENLIKNFDNASRLGRDEVLRPGAIGASVGIKLQDFELAHILYDMGCKILCVDVAHGDHESVSEFVAKLRNHCPDVLIVAGNVVTESGARYLWDAGADIIKVGVGPGSLCTTRVETGNGYPQLSALKNVCDGDYKPRGGNDEPPEWPAFIADGGIKNAGDCVKALAFADLVMIGNLFAGTDEAPGNIISVGGQQYKQYVGSSTHKQNHIEGVVGLVPYKGGVEGVVTRLSEGIRSGCSYQGAPHLFQLKVQPEFVVISNAGLHESLPHNVTL
jgi:IMP dehydrogenase